MGVEKGFHLFINKGYKLKMNLRNLQYEVDTWARKNFPDATPEMPLIGLQEEVGELAHFHLKGMQGIRHTGLEIYRGKQDSVGDILVFLANYCNLNNLDLQDCGELAWGEVKERDWQSNKVTGVSLAELKKASDESGEVLDSSFRVVDNDEFIKPMVHTQGLIEFKPFGFAQHSEDEKGVPV